MVVAKATQEYIAEVLLLRDQKIEELELKVINQEAKINDQEAKINDQEAKINDQDFRIQILESTRNVQSKINEHLARAIDDNNQYSRVQNLLIDGVVVPKDASDNHIRQLVINLFKKMKVNINDSDVVRAHRTGRPYYDKNGKLHCPIICRFTSWYPRNEVYQKRKDVEGVYFKADLTARRQNLIYDLQSLLECNERAGDLISYVYADRNCRVSIRCKDERFMVVNTIEEFELLLDHIENTAPRVKHSMNAMDANRSEVIVPHLVNLKTINDVTAFLDQPNTEYIGRRSGDIKESKWQNPYSLNDFDIDTSLKKYREHVFASPPLIDNIKSLRGKLLCCFCEDGTLCHGKILIDLAYQDS